MENVYYTTMQPRHRNVYPLYIIRVGEPIKRSLRIKLEHHPKSWLSPEEEEQPPLPLNDIVRMPHIGQIILEHVRHLRDWEKWKNKLREMFMVDGTPEECSPPLYFAVARVKGRYWATHTLLDAGLMLMAGEFYQCERDREELKLLPFFEEHENLTRQDHHRIMIWYDKLCYHFSIREWSSDCLLYTSPRPRDGLLSRMPSSS